MAAFYATGVPIANAQEMFAHNDYVKPRPFHKAFELKADYIEADIFLENGVLLVAHTKSEIDPSKTLEAMYLKPLYEHKKDLYGLTLMIDLKTEGAPTLSAFVQLLQKFPELTNHPNLTIAISGSYPPPSEWKNYPGYIWFDGRPNVNYSADQQARLKLISTSFSSISGWDGNGEIPSSDLKKIKEVVDWSHAKNLPVRFWAAPDFENAWEKLKAAEIDIINSDHIDELAAWLKR